MPLMKSGSKKAFKHNVEVEMAAHPDKRAQDLAIAYSLKRKAKKMAAGGPVSAKTEKRPMPTTKANDAHIVAQNDTKKPLKESTWVARPDKVASNRVHTTPIKHPRMAQSTGFSTKLLNQEDHLEQAAKVNDGPQHEPKEDYNEEGADRHGPKVHKMKMMAKGGEINDEISMHEAEEDHVMHPAGLESDNDEMAIPEEESMAGHFADGGHVDEDEMALDHHASIVAAIMAKRAAKHAFADGGEVDIDENAEESPADPDQYDDQNMEAAMKENYDEDMDDAHQPEDSDEHGDSEEDESENKHDKSIVSKIMAKKRKKSPITR